MQDELVIDPGYSSSRWYWLVTGARCTYSVIRLSIGFLLSLLIAFPLHASEESRRDTGFKLQDFLGRDWQNEAVRFPLSSDQLKNARARRALVGPDEKPVPYQ